MTFRLLPRCVCAFAVFLLCACQTERVTTSDGWALPPPPRPMPVPPAALKADRMAFMVGSKPDDTDNNGFPDAIRASVALFSADHPTALHEHGTFVFLLFSQGQSQARAAKPIAQWRVEDVVVAGGGADKGGTAALAMTQYGPCYQFTLSLLERPLGGGGWEGAGDRIPLNRADIICRFEPADGSPPVTSDGVRIIQIGRRM